MIKFILRLCLVQCFLLTGVFAFSQGAVTVSGTVKNSKSKEAIPAVSILVKGGTSGDYTDDNGKFKFTTNQKLPFTIVISSIGYDSKEVEITSSGQVVEVELEPAYMVGQEIVVAASRVPQRLLEAPVSIERINSSAIRSAPATSYYDILGTLKGVDMVTSSLTFKTPSTRGFNGSGNVRLNQIVDGMDNQAPGLNFSVGGVIGLTELDVDNIELLEGASSALYGSGGMNGTIIINSKDPFKYQGLSLQVKEGVMNVNNSQRKSSLYQDYTLRWAEKLSDKFAFKLSGQFIQANDWLAYDSTNYNLSTGTPIGGTRLSDPNYNGGNLYGDETSQDLKNINALVLNGVKQFVGDATYAAIYSYSQGFLAGNPNATMDQYNDFLRNYLHADAIVDGGYSPFFYGGIQGYYNNGVNVSRTGYKESDVADPVTRDIRISGELEYKITDKLSAIVSGNYGTGNSIYTGSNRFVLKNLKMGQYKAELKSKNWFLRGYATLENSGDAYNATVNTQLLDESWGGGSPTWYPTFTAAYATYRSFGYSAIDAANAARLQADQNRPAPGSAQFNRLADSIAKLPIPKGGHFLDRTNLFVVEGQYDLTDAFNIKNDKTDVLVGGNFKQYELNSQGTLFADTTGKIGISEVGLYAQVSHKFFNDVLKLAITGRYDKNQNFDGHFTPRASAVIQVAKNQNIRLSYQSAYRFPTTQNQWINLNVGSAILIGGLPQLRDIYHLNPENKPYNPGYTPESVQAAAAAGGDISKLVVQPFGKYKPESANSYEIGYKGLVANDKLLIDIYGYYAQYKDLLTRINVIQSNDGTPLGLFTGNYQPFSISVNSPTKVHTSGFGASLQWLLRNNYSINTNFFSDNIGDVPAGYKSYWSTPKYRANIGFSNSGFGPQKRLGFNIAWRWQDAFYYESDFLSGNVSAYSTLDAQVSYKFTTLKTLLKLGATNLTNHYYKTAVGNPYIGGLYYISIGYNVF